MAGASLGLASDLRGRLPQVADAFALRRLSVRSDGDDALGGRTLLVLRPPHVLCSLTFRTIHLSRGPVRPCDERAIGPISSAVHHFYRAHRKYLSDASRDTHA